MTNILCLKIIIIICWMLWNQSYGFTLHSIPGSYWDRPLVLFFGVGKHSDARISDNIEYLKRDSIVVVKIIKDTIQDTIKHCTKDVPLL